MVVVMGVTGSGKTTLAAALARRLGWQMLDGDDLHSAASVSKMAAGVPLADADRADWLDALAAAIARALEAGPPLVVASSALKRAYRRRLGGGDPRVAFVWLRVDRDELERRLRARHGHFAGVEILPSQLATLEPPLPGEALAIDATAPPEELVDRVLTALWPGAAEDGGADAPE